MMERARQERQRKANDAKRFFEEGKRAYEAGKPAAAEASLYLATQRDPQNKEYRDLLQEVQLEARRIKVDNELAEAESALTLSAYPKAIHHYRAAIKAGESRGLIDAPTFANLSRLVLNEEKETHDAVRLMEKAAEKDPTNPEYRRALAQLFSSLGMELRAKRESRIAERLDAERKRGQQK